MTVHRTKEFVCINVKMEPYIHCEKHDDTKKEDDNIQRQVTGYLERSPCALFVNTSIDWQSKGLSVVFRRGTSPRYKPAIRRCVDSEVLTPISGNLRTTPHAPPSSPLFHNPFPTL